MQPIHRDSLKSSKVGIVTAYMLAFALGAMLSLLAEVLVTRGLSGLVRQDVLIVAGVAAVVMLVNPLVVRLIWALVKNPGLLRSEGQTDSLAAMNQGLIICSVLGLANSPASNLISGALTFAMSHFALLWVYPFLVLLFAVYWSVRMIKDAP